MTHIVPFRAVRPVRDKVHLVASRSYVSYSRKDLREKLHGNPFTFIHIINPEFDQIKRSRPNSRARFQSVKRAYQKFVDRGILFQDEIPSLYIYRQTNESCSFTGIISGISIDDYLEGRIRKHEHTLTVREKMFADYLDECQFNAEPVLLTYQPQEVIDQKIAELASQRPEYEFTTTDYVKHELWQITNAQDIVTFQKAFEALECVYIADGHHRTASSALLGHKKRLENPNFSGREGFNYLMTLLIPENQLAIAPFHRFVKTLNGHTPEGIIQLLEKSFDIIETDVPVMPVHRHQFGFYCSGKWYRLELARKVNQADPVESLDPWILNEFVLTPIWGITDLKTDRRISFRGGHIDPVKLQRDVDNGKFAALFTLYPVGVEQLKDVADAHEIMPPKSTWIEPKLRSGLTIFNLESEIIEPAK